MLKQHEVEVLLKAGRAKIEVAGSRERLFERVALINY